MRALRVLAALALVLIWSAPRGTVQNRMGDAAGRTLAGAAGAAGPFLPAPSATLPSGSHPASFGPASAVGSDAPSPAGLPVSVTLGAGTRNVHRETEKPSSADGSSVSAQSSFPAEMTAPPAAPALRGYASWYCEPGVSACTAGYAAPGAFAAAGPAIRAALGPSWQGRAVTVVSGGRAVVVRLIDWCRCPDGTLLDLYGSVFARLAPLSAGIVEVEVWR